jgi:hypothetical protein
VDVVDRSSADGVSDQLDRVRLRGLLRRGVVPLLRALARRDEELVLADHRVAADLEPAPHDAGHLRGHQVAEVLAKARRRIERVLARRHGRSPGQARPRGAAALHPAPARRPGATRFVIPEGGHRARPDGLVRTALKKPLSDGTVAGDLDPLSLLLRLCAAVPALRFHTIRYAGVLA